MSCARAQTDQLLETYFRPKKRAIAKLSFLQISFREILGIEKYIGRKNVVEVRVTVLANKKNFISLILTFPLVSFQR